MRWALALAGLGLLVGLVWLAGSSSRVRQGSLGGSAPAPEAPLETALLEPRPLAPLEPEETAGGTRHEPAAPRARDGTKRPPEAAPLRGRVVLGDTDEAIEAPLSVRVRTIDLTRAESQLTRPDGRFATRTAFRAGRMLALVKDEEGRELVDQEAFYDPASPDEWLVHVPFERWPTFVRGSVVDGRGRPLAHVRLRLLPRSADAPFSEAQSGRDGRFELRDLLPGRYQLRLEGRWAAPAPLDLEIHRGPNDVGVLRFDEPAPAGDLIVRLAADAPGFVPRARLEVRGQATGFSSALDTQRAWRGEDGVVEVRFRSLPADHYTLGVRCLDGLESRPASAEFEPPATVELTLSGTPRDRVRFQPIDGRTGDPILFASFLGRIENTWEFLSMRGGVRPTDPGELVVAPVFDEWYLWSPGYRAAHGTFDGLAGGETIRVELFPGSTELLQFEDGETAAPFDPENDAYLSPAVLAGVQVFVGAELAGVSDERGLLEISRDAPFESSGYRYPGRRAIMEYDLAGILRTIVMAR